MLCFTFIMKESYFIGYLLSCDTYRSGLWVLKPKTQNAKLRRRPESLRHHAALRREYHLKREIRRREPARRKLRRRISRFRWYSRRRAAWCRKDSGRRLSFAFCVLGFSTHKPDR